MSQKTPSRSLEDIKCVFAVLKDREKWQLGLKEKEKASLSAHDQIQDFVTSHIRGLVVGDPRYHIKQKTYVKRAKFPVMPMASVDEIHSSALPSVESVYVVDAKTNAQQQFEQRIHAENSARMQQQQLDANYYPYGHHHHHHHPWHHHHHHHHQPWRPHHHHHHHHHHMYPYAQFQQQQMPPGGYYQQQQQMPPRGYYQQQQQMPMVPPPQPLPEAPFLPGTAVVDPSQPVPPGMTRGFVMHNGEMVARDIPVADLNAPPEPFSSASAWSRHPREQQQQQQEQNTFEVDDEVTRILREVEREERDLYRQQQQQRQSRGRDRRR